MAYPAINMPETFVIDDRMFIFPASIPDPAVVAIIRGPNIGAPPSSTLFPAHLAGSVTIKVGDKITTDHIIPAGARMKYRSNIPKYAEFVFESVDPGFAGRAQVLRDAGSHNIIVAGASYGEGSSREHAALCPMFLGVKMVLAKSVQRIHMDNLVNFGILPCTFRNEMDYDTVETGDELTAPGIACAIAGNVPLVIRNKSRGRDIAVEYSLTPRQRRILLAGGALALRKQDNG